MGFRRAGVLWMCLALGGCSRATTSAPALVPVSGTVTLDGKPLVGAMVRFTPQQGTIGAEAFGTTDVDGRYSLTHRTEKPGAECGTYTVWFSKMALRDGSPIPPDKTAADVEAVEHVPRRYTAASQATGNAQLTSVTVGTNGGIFDFALVAGPRR